MRNSGTSTALDRTRHLDHTLAEAGLDGARTSTSSWRRTCTSITPAGSPSATRADGVRPRFPRAQYVVRRGEWEDATHPNERNRASYLAHNYVPLADAGVLQLVDDDQTIMPGVKVRRTGGHTMHHQIVLLESGGSAAAFVADLIPTTAHLPNAWIMGYDLYPLDTLAVKHAFVREAIEREHAGILRARPVDRGRVHPGRERQTPGGSSAEPVHVRSCSHDSPNRNHRRQRPVRDGRIDRPRGAHDPDTVRRPVGSVRHRHAARQAGGVSRSPRRRSPHPAIGAELSREHLRLQGPRGRAYRVGQRRRQPQGGIQAARHARARSVLRPDEGPDQHVLRPRARGACRVRASGVPDPVGDCGRCGAGGWTPPSIGAGPT